MFVKAVEIAMKNKEQLPELERIKRATSGQDDLVTQLANQIEELDEELIRQIRAGTIFFTMI